MAGYLVSRLAQKLYLVFGMIFDQMSGICSYKWLNIQYLFAYIFGIRAEITFSIRHGRISGIQPIVPAGYPAYRSILNLG